jgi:hypothetical protein
MIWPRAFESDKAFKFFRDDSSFDFRRDYFNSDYIIFPPQQNGMMKASQYNRAENT